MKRVNNWLAVKITELVGTMWCAYIFVGLAILGFPYGSDRLPDYVQWVSQTFIQLVMLSVIMVGQNLITAKQNEHGDKLDEHADKLDAVHDHLELVRLIAKYGLPPEEAEKLQELLKPYEKEVNL